MNVIAYEMDITFRYAEKLVAINPSDCPAGAAIALSLY